jgi:phospholipid transport system substrate-binding protein
MKHALRISSAIVICFVSVAAVGLRPRAAWAQASDSGADTHEVVGAIAGGSPTTQETDARALVARLEAALLDIMKRAEALGFEGRLREISPVVEDTFDLEFMARTCIGRVWKEMTPELRTQWVDSFSRYTSTKFADQFDRYSGQEFVLGGERPGSRETLIVMTSVQRQGREPVRLDFRVHRTDGKWRIIDVYGKGRVSELALRRSEYDSIVKESGVAGLIESVDELSRKTAENAIAAGVR